MRRSTTPLKKIKTVKVRLRKRTNILAKTLTTFPKPNNRKRLSKTPLSI